MKRFHVIIASGTGALFFILFIIYLTFSHLNSQIANTALSLIELFAVVGIVGAIGILAGLRQPNTTYGQAHFATPQEIQHSGFVAEQDSLIVGESKRLMVGVPPRGQLEHVLLVATTGAGKSTGIIIPGLLSETGRRGIFVNDMKGELYQKTAGALSRHLPVSLFSPTRPQASVHYNPLAHIHSQEDAEDLAACWTANTGVSREEYYNQVAQLLLTAAVLHLVDTEPDAPFSRLADLLSGTTFDQIQSILTNSKSKRARDIASAFLSSAGQDAKLAGGIMSGMATRFLLMKNPTLRKLTSTHLDTQHNISFPRLSQKPEVLFLSIPASDTRRLRPLTSLLVMQMMNDLTKQSEAKPFVLYMDELANIGKIPHYAEHISLVRGQGIALIQAIQSFSQLSAVYDPQDAQTILANSTTKIFYPGMGKPECEYASQLLGTTTVTVKSKSISPERSETSHETVTKRPLMNLEDIRQLKRGDLIVVSGNLPPMLVYNTPYYQQSALVELVDLPLQQLPASP